MKKVKVIEVYSRGNEVYLVLPEHRNDKPPRCDDLSCSEVKKIMKEEAAKPLYLLRTERIANLNPVGLWTLHFDWGPKGNYSWTPLYFNFDGTFAYLAGDNEGAWVQVDDMIILRFKRSSDAENNTVYSGSTNRNFMSGIMMSSQGDKGHWYAIKKGTRVFAVRERDKLPYLIEKESKPKLDPAGKTV